MVRARKILIGLNLVKLRDLHAQMTKPVLKTKNLFLPLWRWTYPETASSPQFGRMRNLRLGLGFGINTGVARVAGQGFGSRLGSAICALHPTSGHFSFELRPLQHPPT